MKEGLSKIEVIDIIKRNLKDNLYDVDEDAIEASSTMRDFGANSLDMIEVVNATMRELKIRVPQSELSEIKTIGRLADKFLEYL